MRVEAGDQIRQARVFLSYARADRARVARLAEALTGAGLTVWWDTAIETGSQFSEDIERELDAADVVVVVWSAASVKSTWVRDEAGHGRDRGRLLPVQIDGTLPPLGFRQFQSTDLSDWKGRAGDARIAGLAAAIRKLAGDASGAGELAVTQTASGPSRRAAIGGLAGVAAPAVGGFGAWKLWGGRPDDGTASVVVLPFANLSGDPSQAFFSDGIAEELRSALSQIRGLRVIGRVTSEQFRDAEDLSAVADRLGVDHILTGSVRRSPTTIRIGAQLVDGRSGVENWSESYDQPIGDALAIQSRIANAVVAALSPRLAKSAGTIAVGGTRNARAQELLLKGGKLYFTDASTEGLREVAALLDAAIALDPNYADAWAVRGIVKINLASSATSAAERAALRQEALADLKRAVALAPGGGGVRAFYAISFVDDLDMRGFLTEGERAIALAPGNGVVLNAVAQSLRFLDPDRSVELSGKAVSLDPLNPFFLAVRSGALLAARRPEEAADAARSAMALSEGQRGAENLFDALMAMNGIDAARSALRKIQSPRNRLFATATLAARTGDRMQSDVALAALGERYDDSVAFVTAIVHAQRGEAAAALDALDAALTRREGYLSSIAVTPWLDPIRREPRFRAIQDAVIPPDLFVPPKRGQAMSAGSAS